MNWRIDSSLTDLAADVALQAIRAGITLGTAESCTGGLVAHLLTRTAGVSAVFMGGIVVYSNVAKHDLLGVSRQLLESNGAVSEPAARAMAHGARERLHVDLAVATTGVAGPGGGSVTKPVGLTFVAVQGSAIEACARFEFVGDRAANVESATREALILLANALANSNV